MNTFQYYTLSLYKINSKRNDIITNLRRSYYVKGVESGYINWGQFKGITLPRRFFSGESSRKLQVMGFTISREIISQMELGKHNIRISVLLALKEMYEATYDEIFADIYL